MGCGSQCKLENQLCMDYNIGHELSHLDRRMSDECGRLAKTWVGP
jgi:hypothetical protein